MAVEVIREGEKAYWPGTFEVGEAGTLLLYDNFCDLCLAIAAGHWEQAKVIPDERVPETSRAG